MDDVFDTIGTDEVESEYFIGNHLNAAASPNFLYAGNRHESASEDMSLNHLESVSSSDEEEDGDGFRGNSNGRNREKDKFNCEDTDSDEGRFEF